MFITTLFFYWPVQFACFIIPNPETLVMVMTQRFLLRLQINNFVFYVSFCHTFQNFVRDQLFLNVFNGLIVLAITAILLKE